MIIAGFGARASATDASFKSALDAALVGKAPDALAIMEPKSEQLQPLASAMGLALIKVPVDHLATQQTLTKTEASQAAYGTGSVAEATACAAAGAKAKLMGPRAVSTDRLATCAIAIGPKT